MGCGKTEIERETREDRLEKLAAKVAEKGVHDKGIRNLVSLWARILSKGYLPHACMLGHKNIQNTMKYIHMIHFKDDAFDVEAATNVEEAKQLLAAGFNYVLEKTTSCSSEDPKDSAPRRKVTVCEQESSFVDTKHHYWRHLPQTPLFFMSCMPRFRDQTRDDPQRGQYV